MSSYWLLRALFVGLAFQASTVVSFEDTAQRIAKFNYPVETHEVVTDDGYILKVFRIPNSPKSLNNTTDKRPIAFLQHGILCSSDSFILNGPDNSIAYLLADEGFDVWLSNTRGNIYSSRNVNISSYNPSFWDFNWHEMGTHDLPALIDHILQLTNQDGIHYIGHSQGTTCFFVLLSELPSYNSKIKTAHMLAPVTYLSHFKSIPAFVVAFFTYLVSPIITGYQVYKGNLLRPLRSFICANGSWLQWICYDFIFLFGGFDRDHFNYTLLEQVGETFPAGSSAQCFIHYVQIFESGRFMKYSYGILKNEQIYGQLLPPDYNVKNITCPMRFYYGENDYLATPEDVKKMEKLLPNLVESYKVPVKTWAHFDFLWAIDVKKYINDKVIETCKYYEKTKKQL